MKRRGMSDVVATVLIILLTVAAVAMLSSFLVPFVKNKLAQSSECLDYQNFYNFNEKYEFNGKTYRYNCYQKDSSDYYTGAMVESKENKTALQPLGFQIVFNAQSDTKAFAVKNNDAASQFYMRENPTAKINIPNSGESILYVYKTATKFDSIDIYPILVSGRVCEQKASIKLEECEGVNLK